MEAQVVDKLQDSDRLPVPTMTALRALWLRFVGGFARLLGAREMAAIAYSQIGQIQGAAKNYAGAAASYQRAFELDRDPSMRALDLGNLAYCQYRLGKLDEAARAYQTGLTMRYRVRFFDGIETDLRRYYHVCHYLGQPQEACEAYGMLMTPRGSPVGLQFEHYPLELDERAEELASVRVV